MSKQWIIFALGLATPLFAECGGAVVESKAEPKVEAKAEVAAEVKAEKKAPDIDKVSETLGHLIVRHLDNPGFKFNVEKIVQGIKDEKEGKAAPMTEEEYEQTISQIQETIFTQLAEKNLESANSFLEKNGKEEGVISLNPKLQYKILAKGEGDKIASESSPLVHYSGKLLDGTVFSSSKEGGKPITLPIKQTIPGFSEGLVGMQKGEKRVLYIHPELAYGVSGHLPPNSLLIFEVEVVEVDAKPEPVAGEAQTAETAPTASAEAPKAEELTKTAETAPKAAEAPKEVSQKEVKQKGRKKAKK